MALAPRTDPPPFPDLPNYSAYIRSRDVSRLTYEDGFERARAGEALPLIHSDLPYWRGVSDGWAERNEDKRREAWNTITGEIEAARPELV